VKFRLRAEKQHIEGNIGTEDICGIFGISKRALGWWCRRYKEEGMIENRILRRNGLMVRVKRKLKPSKRFQSYHVDSLWQYDICEFQIADMGKVYVFNSLDDRSSVRFQNKFLEGNVVPPMRKQTQGKVAWIIDAVERGSLPIHRIAKRAGVTPRWVRELWQFRRGYNKERLHEGIE